MHGKTSRMSPLAMRKQLLVAESDLNRVQLADDITALKVDIHTLADRMKSFGSIAATIAGVMSCFNGKATTAAPKPAWWQAALKGVGIASNFWLMLRSRSRKPQDE